MNIVVLTAALSSLNSGLYCTGRILRSMAMGGSAPSFMAKMSRQHVPYAGILATLVVYVVGVFLNYLVPSRVFEIVLNFASLGIIASWAFIIVCQMRLRKAIKEGKAADVSFKTAWRALHFLADITVFTECPCADGVRLPERDLYYRGAADYRYFAGYRLVWCAQTRC